jgi:hypothetical protein
MHWLAANWFNVVQTAALIATLAVAASALRSSGRATKGSNTLTLAANNRQIWSQLTADPKLQSVLRTTMTPNEDVSYEEYRFVVQVIHHTVTGFELARMGGINPVEGARRDAYHFMNLPVFRTVWEQNKIYQNADFVNFIDGCMAGIDLDTPLGRPHLIQRITKKVQSKFRTIHRWQPFKGGIERRAEKRKTDDMSAGD